MSEVPRMPCHMLVEVTDNHFGDKVDVVSQLPACMARQ